MYIYTYLYKIICDMYSHSRERIIALAQSHARKSVTPGNRSCRWFSSVAVVCVCECVSV